MTQDCIYSTFNCNLCNKTFEELFLHSSNQALGCAAEVYVTHIRGYYGSKKYDDIRIDFIDAMPKELKLGDIVCDNCIDNLIKDGICQNLFIK